MSQPTDLTRLSHPYTPFPNTQMEERGSREHPMSTDEPSSESEETSSGSDVRHNDESQGQSRSSETSSSTRSTDSSSDSEESEDRSQTENRRSQNSSFVTLNQLSNQLRAQQLELQTLQFQTQQPVQLRLNLERQLAERQEQTNRLIQERLASLSQQFNQIPFTNPSLGSTGSGAIRINAFLFSYTFLLTPAQKKESDCSVCLNPSPNFSFCQNNHIFHEDCIIGFIYAKSHYFNRGNYYLRRDYYIRQQYEIHSRYSRSSYEVTIPEENLPQCPECRDTGHHGFLEVQVTDATHGTFSADVSIRDSKSSSINHLLAFPLLNKLIAFFTIFQAALAHVQRRPEVSLIVFKAQKFLIISDIIAILRNHWELYSILNKKYNLVHKQQNQHEQGNRIFRKIVPKLTSAAVLACSVALSALGIFIFRKKLSRNVNLTEILSKLVSAKELKNVSVKWDWPIFYTMIQFLYINRLISELGLVFFSSKPLTHLSYAMLQLFSLFRISQLKWIKLEKTDFRPLFKIAALDFSGKPLSDSFRNGVDEITTIFKFFLPPCFVRDTNVSLCQNERTRIQSTMKSIIDYSNNLFQNSRWHRDLFQLQNYQIKLQPSLLANYSCHVKPVLDSIIIKVTSIAWHYGISKVYLTGYSTPSFLEENSA